MVDVMLDFMLGPIRGIGDIYFEHQMIFNSIIVGAAFLKILLKTKKSKTANEA
ncbi:hypothetical protein [Shouchella shacheensis]|uniref:hypothetical protein n=1 Tax=Shouchella shacheensis TaxID=1649580 RepID=UPI000A59F5A8|nr:hypothetical protein [Shouchella shacheensis]